MFQLIGVVGNSERALGKLRKGDMPTSREGFWIPKHHRSVSRRDLHFLTDTRNFHTATLEQQSVGQSSGD